jgi:hypothetical protein
VGDSFVAAARAMEQDGFWWADPALTNKSIKRRILREMLAASSTRSRESHTGEPPGKNAPAQ